MDERLDRLNLLGQYIEIGGFCFPVACWRIWENVVEISDPRANGEPDDYSKKEFPILRMSMEEEDAKSLFPGKSYLLLHFCRLRDDPATGKWLTEEAMKARIEAMIAAWDHQQVIEVCKRKFHYVPDYSHHSKWDWEPGYGPSY